MTPTERQAALEQVARELVDQFMMDTKDSEYTVIEGTDSDLLAARIAALLAAQRAAGLEEVAQHYDGVSKAFDMVLADGVAMWCRQQAQERRP